MKSETYGMPALVVRESYEKLRHRFRVDRPRRRWHFLVSTESRGYVVSGYISAGSIYGCGVIQVETLCPLCGRGCAATQTVTQAPGQCEPIEIHSAVVDIVASESERRPRRCFIESSSCRVKPP